MGLPRGRPSLYCLFLFFGPPMLPGVRLMTSSSTYSMYSDKHIASVCSDNHIVGAFLDWL
jgi:hypothetical protein